MAYSVSVTRGYTMVAGVKPDVDDWNAAFLPIVNLSGAVGSSDISDDAITFALLNPNLILGGTAIEDVDSADMFLVGQASSGDNRVITFQYLLRSVIRETAEVNVFADWNEDHIVFWRYSDDLPVSIGLARFFQKMIEQAPGATTFTQDDEVLVRRPLEADGSQVAKASLRNLLPDIITAQTVNNPTQVVVDAKGRITSISGTEGSNRFTSAETPLPTGAGAANQVDIAHGLGAIPAFVNVWLKCTDAGGDGTWAQNDIVALGSVLHDTGGSDVNTPYVVRITATNVSILKPAGSAITIPSKTDGTDQTFTASKWAAIVQAQA